METQTATSNTYSKQLSYYYRNKDKINQQRRNNYRTNNSNKGKTKKITKYNKSNNNRERSFKVFLDRTFIINEGKEPQNNLILPKKWIIDVKAGKTSNYTYSMEKCQIRDSKKRITRNRIYSLILQEIYPARYISYFEFRKFGVPERTFKRYLKELENTKWIMRIKSSGRLYVLNPLLQFLLENNHIPASFLDYACYKIDLHRLLSYPLRLIKNPIEFTAKVLWQKSPINNQKEVLKDEPHLWSVFHGIFYIKAKMPNGLEVQTFLPINYHHDFLKHTINPHYTIPCDWNLFNIKESTHYTGFSQKAKRRVKVHFDNSIKIMYFRDFQRYWIFKRPYEKAIAKWDGSEFIEFTTTAKMEELFTLRFKEGYTRTELFKKMGLELKPMKHKNRTNRKERMSKLEPVNNDEWEQKEKIPTLR